MSTRYVLACDACGKVADATKPPTDWLYTTQPLRVFCHLCKLQEGKLVKNDNPYDEDYYLRGRQSGKSLYENYRWMPELTIPMVGRIVEHCGIHGDTILDFGCARGYTVRAFRELDYRAYGIDISYWAINNSDPYARAWLSLGELTHQHRYDWVIAKDVLEHISFIENTIDLLMQVATKGIFVVVPLSWITSSTYVILDYEKDVTHIQRRDLLSWISLFLREGWSVEASYRIPGIKDNWAGSPTHPEWAKGNGFLTMRRISE